MPCLSVLGGHTKFFPEIIRYTWQNQFATNAQKGFVKRYEITNRYDTEDKIPNIQLIQFFPQLFDGFVKGDSLAEWLELFKNAHQATPEYVKENVTNQGVLAAYDILKQKDLPHDPDEIAQWETGYEEGIEKGAGETQKKITRALKVKGIFSEEEIEPILGVNLKDLKE